MPPDINFTPDNTNANNYAIQKAELSRMLKVLETGGKTRAALLGTLNLSESKLVAQDLHSIPDTTFDSLYADYLSAIQILDTVEVQRQQKEADDRRLTQTHFEVSGSDMDRLLELYLPILTRRSQSLNDFHSQLEIQPIPANNQSNYSNSKVNKKVYEKMMAECLEDAQGELSQEAEKHFKPVQQLLTDHDRTALGRWDSLKEKYPGLAKFQNLLVGGSVAGATGLGASALNIPALIAAGSVAAPLAIVLPVLVAVLPLLLRRANKFIPGSDRSKFQSTITKAFDDQCDALLKSSFNHGIPKPNQVSPTSLSDFKTYTKTVKDKTDRELINTVEETKLLNIFAKLPHCSPAGVPYLQDLDLYTQFFFVEFSSIATASASSPLLRGLSIDEVESLRSLGGARKLEPNEPHHDWLKKIYEVARAYAMAVQREHEGRRNAKVEMSTLLTGGALAASAVGGPIVPVLTGGAIAVQKLRKWMTGSTLMQFNESGVLEGIDGRPMMSPEVTALGGALYDIGLLQAKKHDTVLEGDEKRWHTRLEQVPLEGFASLLNNNKYQDVQSFARDYDAHISTRLVGTRGIAPQASPEDIQRAQTAFDDAKKLLDTKNQEVADLPDQIEATQLEIDGLQASNANNKNAILINQSQIKKKRLEQKLTYLNNDEQDIRSIMYRKKILQQCEDALKALKKPDQSSAPIITRQSLLSNQALKVAFAVKSNQLWHNYEQYHTQSQLRPYWQQMRLGLKNWTVGKLMSGKQMASDVGVAGLAHSAGFASTALLINSLIGTSISWISAAGVGGVIGCGRKIWNMISRTVSGPPTASSSAPQQPTPPPSTPARP